MVIFIMSWIESAVRAGPWWIIIWFITQKRLQAGVPCAPGGIYLFILTADRLINLWSDGFRLTPSLYEVRGSRLDHNTLFLLTFNWSPKQYFGFSPFYIKTRFESNILNIF